jgi:S1-C subfamily serine protease
MLAKYLRTDTTPFPGFSGGPLVESGGQILGMNTSGLAGGVWITIPNETLWPAAASLAAHGHIKRAYLGIRSQNVKLDKNQQHELGREQESALLLVGIEENSSAAKAGMIVGDILVGIHGNPVENHDMLQTWLAQEQIGGEVRVDILRAGKPASLGVILGERPS